MLLVGCIAAEAACWRHAMRLTGDGSILEWLISYAFSGAFAAGGIGAMLGRFWRCFILGLVLSALGECLYFFCFQ